MKRLMFIIAVSVAAAWIIRTYLIEVIMVTGGGMEPTLAVGSRHLLNKFIYHIQSPARGDVIAFVDPLQRDRGSMGRIIGISGDKVEIRAKQVYLNEKPLDEPYTVHKRPNEMLSGDNTGPVTVPESQVFVLGDDRDEAADSSTWKDPQTGQPIYFVPLSDVTGRVM